MVKLYIQIEAVGKEAVELMGYIRSMHNTHNTIVFVIKVVALEKLPT